MSEIFKSEKQDETRDDEGDTLLRLPNERLRYTRKFFYSLCPPSRVLEIEELELNPSQHDKEGKDSWQKQLGEDMMVKLFSSLYVSAVPQVKPVFINTKCVARETKRVDPSYTKPFKTPYKKTYGTCYSPNARREADGRHAFKKEPRGETEGRHVFKNEPRGHAESRMKTSSESGRFSVFPEGSSFPPSVTTFPRNVMTVESGTSMTTTEDSQGFTEFNFELSSENAADSIVGSPDSGKMVRNQIPKTNSVKSQSESSKNDSKACTRQVNDPRDNKNDSSDDEESKWRCSFLKQDIVWGSSSWY